MAKTANTTKTFSSRSSATGALKKLGIQKEDYNRFIIKTSDGKLTVNVQAAVNYIKNLEAEALAAKNKATAPKPAAPKPAAPVSDKDQLKALAAKAKDKASKVAELAKTKDAEKKAKKSREGTVSDICRKFIIEDPKRSNADVWALLKKQFPTLPEEHKWYPAWYRSQLRRKGLLK
jgi:hypothetical protein